MTHTALARPAAARPEKAEPSDLGGRRLAAVLAYTALLFLVGLGQWPFVQSVGSFGAPFQLPWWGIYLMVVGAAVLSHDIPVRIGTVGGVVPTDALIVFGLLFSPPELLVIFWPLGVVSDVVIFGTPPLRVLYNCAHQFLCASSSVLLVSSVAGSDSSFARLAVGILLANMLFQSLFTSWSIAIVRRLYSGQWPPFNPKTAITEISMTVIALAAAAQLWFVPSAPWLALLTLAVCMLGFRMINQSAAHTVRLDRLYRLTGALSGSLEPDVLQERILSSTREMLSCNVAMVIEWTGHDKTIVADSNTKDERIRLQLAEHGWNDAMIAPLPIGAHYIGSLVAANRVKGSPNIQSDDILILEAVASHAAVALENGRLAGELRHQVHHDSLTGLANRALFNERLSEILEDSDVARAAVLLIDLDKFKHVNDTLGHHVGDELLCEVARRFESVIRPSDTVARLGGDEFAILLTDVDRISACHRAQEILESLVEPVTVEGHDLEVGASIGIAAYPEDATVASILLLRADKAMYTVKARGGGYELFNPRQHDAVDRREASI